LEGLLGQSLAPQRRPQVAVHDRARQGITGERQIHAEPDHAEDAHGDGHLAPAATPAGVDRPVDPGRRERDDLWISPSKKTAGA
jgi:hypothetical protein